MLRKNSIKFWEAHNSDNYVLKFNINTKGGFKSYEFTIDVITSRIVHMTVYKDPNFKILEINNRDGTYY